jgi:carotenoid cleavage dioxygenase-like enzyme
MEREPGESRALCPGIPTIRGTRRTIGCSGRLHMMAETIDRRTLLRLGGYSAIGIAAANMVAACGGGTSRATSATTTLGTPTTVVDPSLPWWLRGDFAPVEREVDAVDLPVIGSLPRELSGLYVRNGSNPKSGWAPHWFLGDGMVHGVMLGDGKATWYRNRYVRTTLLADGGGLTAKGAPGGAAGLSNVSLVHHAGKLLSLGEVGFPYELRPRDLSTVGAYDYRGMLRGNMTAHPKIDPATGQMHFFGYNFSEPYLLYHVADRNGVLVSSQSVSVKASTMMHDFAITDRDVVFWEMPVLFDLQLAVKMVSEKRSRVMPYVWTPEYGARIGVMPLGGPTTAIRWVEIEPCYVFHGMNAWREGDDVVLDVCRLGKVFDGSALGPPSRLHRWRIGTRGTHLTFHDEQRSETAGDLPSIDRRRAGREYQHGWRVATGTDPDDVVLGGAIHVDARTGTETRWDPGPQFASGEWLFVATGPDEGDGVVMSFVHDATRNASELTVLDARDIGAGPLARVPLPQRVPLGFHAAWVPAEAI